MDSNYRILLRAVILVGILLAIVVPISKAEAATSQQVEVTAMGYITGPLVDFTLTYVSDTEIDIDWTMPADATNILIRAAYGHVPTGVTDGYEVYFGSGNTTTDDAVTLATPEVVYYIAWVQNANGVWNPVFAEATTEEMMSASFLFIGLILLAAILTAIALKVNLILFRMSAAVSWIALAVWLFLSDSTNLSMSDLWTQVLGFVFIMMAIASFTLQMVTEVKRESKGLSWNEWGSNPKNKKPSRSEIAQDSYKKSLAGRSGRGKRY